MRFLLFLLIGMLLFGFAFPAFLLIAALAIFVIMGLIVYSMLSGGSFHVYRMGQNHDPFSQRRDAPPDNPEIIEPPQDDEDVYADVSATQHAETIEDEEEADGEIVELPASALHKEDSADLDKEAR